MRRLRKEPNESLSVMPRRYWATRRFKRKVAAILTNNEKESRSWWKSLLGIAAVLVGASGSCRRCKIHSTACGESLEKALATSLAFRVETPGLIDVVLGFGFILIVSFVINTVIDVVLHAVGERLGFAGAWPTWPTT